jgi:serine/threonine protein kinase
LRSRVEGWEIKSHDLSLGDCIGIEQIAVRHKASWKTLTVDVKLFSLPNLHKALDGDELHEDHLLEELFLIEIDVMSKLRHPNIVSFLGACLDMDNENLILVTEHMAGGSLESALARGRATAGRDGGWAPPRRQALTWSLQLAQALNYLHQCRPVLVHRDLSPRRLLLTASGQLKVAGFSYCAAPRDGSPRPSAAASSWLVPLDASYSAADLPDAARRQLALARPYAAPEVAGAAGDLGGEGWDERADAYSMSVIAWELVAGEAPPPAGADRLAGEVEGGLWPRRRGWEGLEALLARGRAADPAARCSVEEALEALEALSVRVAADDAAALCGGRCRTS